MILFICDTKMCLSLNQGKIGYSHSIFFVHRFYNFHTFGRSTPLNISRIEFYVETKSILLTSSIISYLEWLSFLLASDNVFYCKIKLKYFHSNSTCHLLATCLHDVHMFMLFYFCVFQIVKFY